MNLEKLINIPRLKRSEEIENNEVYESTKDLKTKYDILCANILRLENEESEIPRELYFVKDKYYYAKKSLDEFKKTSNAIDGIVERNIDVLTSADSSEDETISGNEELSPEEKKKKAIREAKSNVIQNPRLNLSDEVLDYKRKGQELRAKVKKIVGQKKVLSKRFEKYGDIVFRGDEREESFRAVVSKMDELKNSREVLEHERQKISEQLSYSAYTDIENTYKQKGHVYKDLSWSSLRVYGPSYAYPALDLPEHNFQRIITTYGPEATVLALARMLEDKTVREFTLSSRDLEGYRKNLQLRLEYQVAFTESHNGNSDEAHNVYYKSYEIEKNKEVAHDVLNKIAEARLIYDVPEPAYINIESKDKYDGLTADELYEFKITYPLDAVEKYNQLKKELAELEAQLPVLEKEISDLKAKKPWIFTETWEEKLRKLEWKKSDYESKIGSRKYEISTFYERNGKAVRTRLDLPLYTGCKELNEAIQTVMRNNTYVNDNYGRGYYKQRMESEIHTIPEYLNALERITKKFLSTQKLTDTEILLLEAFNKRETSNKLLAKAQSTWEEAKKTLHQYSF